MAPDRRLAAPSRATAGAQAEALAAEFLAARGVTIVARNFRTRLGEIDLIGHDGATLIFVEVRLRRRDDYGGAGGSVTRSKRERLKAAARGYLSRLGREPPCRFDALLLDTLDPARIEWVRDAFSE